MTSSTPEPTKQPRAHHLFLILPDASGSRILMLPSEKGWRLPYVRVEDIWLSETDKIASALCRGLSLDFDFTILRYAAIETNWQERWQRILFVLEPRQPLQQPPLGGKWVDRMALHHMQLALPEQRTPLLLYLEESEPSGSSPLMDPRRSPWARRGWFASASAWIEEAIAELGATPTGRVEQLRNWSISCLLFAPTSAGRVYFKAAAELPLFVNEPALTQTLADLYPGRVPTPLKIDRTKHWMLMQDFEQVEWGDADRQRAVGHLAPILQAYSNLQRDSAAHISELFAAGCIDRRLSILATQIDPLLSDPATQAVLEPQDFEALLALAPQLKERCARVAASKIPPTLLHGDLHLGNITQRNGGYLFFDWTDASIGFPFLDLFLLYFPEEEEKAKQEEGEKDGAMPIRYRDAYLATWQDFESPQRLLELWELAKPLCALHHAVSYLSIVNHLEPLVRDELIHGLTHNLQRLLASMRA